MRSGSRKPFLAFAALTLFCLVISPSPAQAKTGTTTSLTSSLNPSTYGQSVTLTATVTPVTVNGTAQPTGTVTFTDGTSSTTKTLSGGKATLTSSTLPAGTQAITATYSGDSNFSGSTSPTLDQVVNKASTSISVTSTPNPSSFNQQVTFTATVTGEFGGTPTGSVTFAFGGTTMCGTVSLSSGVATCAYSGLPVGSDTVTVTYSGSSNYSGSSGSELQTVNKASTTTSLTSTPNPSGYLQAVTFTATVTPAPDGGTVTISSSGTNLCSGTPSNGVLTCSYSNLPVGADPVIASYGGDADYGASTSPTLTQTVNAVLVSIAVSPQNLSAAVGGMQQYTAEGTYNNGSQQNITSSVTWSSSSSDATITSGGLVTAASPGSATIQAKQGTISGSSTITVYPANTFFVATNGNDAWSGSLSAPNSPTNPTDGPVASPAEAQLKVRAANQADSQQNPITVFLRGGNYYLAESPTSPGTLTFNNQYDSGTASAGITWQAYPGDSAPVISGGVPANTDPNGWPGVGLNLNWQLKSGTNFNDWYQATLPTTLPISGSALQDFEYFFYNGERRLRSRIHDTASPSVGFYMSGTGTCSAIAGWPAGEFATTLASCNLGSFLRVEGTISPTDTLGSNNGNTCPVSQNGSEEKCLDRFYFTPTGTGGDPIVNWANLTSVSVPSQPCSASTAYPSGDVTLTLFDAWTVDEMRVNCVDTVNNVIYLVGATKSGGGNNNYNFFGPMPNHRFIIENTYNAFTAAQAADATGIWFLDRSAGASGPWVLNYIANSGETPSTANIVIPQLGGSFPGAPATDYTGASLIYATNLNYVTFQGITFQMDNFYPDTNIGFNNDVNGEYPVPQAIDCEGCQFVTFNSVTVQHTSASGILAGATAATPLCSSLSQPTTSNFCVLIENSAFLDIGDSGIRVGHTPSSNDTSGSVVVQDVWANNNLIQGYSRVFADGEGIAEGNGNYNLFSSNTINDGYHAGISVCFNGCPPVTSGSNPVNINGNSIVSQNNLLFNLMQGITSDGGSLYYNLGNAKASGIDSFMTANVVHDVSDSFIIDVVNNKRAAGTGYGGEGLYLDAQTAGVNASDNVVYNISAHPIHITEGLGLSGSSTLTANTFNNNILAFGIQGMFTQGNPWPTGCPATGTIQEVNLTSNIFFFDRSTGQELTGGTPFSVVQGCQDSCIGSFTATQSYNNYQNFTGNDYWSTAENFAGDTDAFQILQQQGSGGLTQQADGSYDCNTSPVDDLSFTQWQGNGSGLPVKMDEDAGGKIFNPASNNPNFPTTGSSGNTPQDFIINVTTGLPSGFNNVLTNNTINNAGSTVTNPNPACTAFPVAVCPTYPTFVFGSSTLPF
jgi:hypothetical protein